MSENHIAKPANRPIVEVAAAQKFYASIGQEVGYFSALWHKFNVGRMLVTISIGYAENSISVRLIPT